MPNSTLNTNERILKESISIALAVILTLLAIFPGIPLLRAAFSGQHAALPPLRFPVTIPTPSRLQSEAGLAKGMFLVASRQLGDPNFLETVIFFGFHVSLTDLL